MAVQEPFYIRLLRRFHLRTRAFILFFLLSVLPTTVIGLLIFHFIFRYQYRQISRQCIQTNLGIRSSLNQIFAREKETITSLIYGSDIQTLLWDSRFLESQSPEIYLKFNEIRQVMVRNAVLDPSVSRVTLKINGLPSPMTYHGEEYTPSSEVAYKQIERCFQSRISQAGGQVIWLPLSRMGETHGVVPQTGGAPRILVGTEMALLKNGEKFGSLYVWFHHTGIEETCQEILYEGEIYLLDENNDVVYSQNREEMGKKFIFESELPDQIEDVYVKKLAREGMILTCSKSDLNHYKYVYMSPYDYMKEDGGQFSFMLLLLLLSVIVESGAIAYIYSKSVRCPIKAMDDIIRHVNAGDFQVAIHDGGIDEMAVLSREIDHMTAHLNQLVNQNDLIKMQENKFRLLALKAQINPHFLFNTLDSIRWIARQNEDFEVSKRLEMLANILRNVVESEKMITTVREEVENTKNYLYLHQGLRNRLKVRWEVEEGTLRAATLKLILQPLVENAIFHGMKPFQTLNIVISIRDRGRFLEFDVKDDGCGIDQERLDVIMSTEYGEDHIGLYNVRNRVQAVLEGSEFRIVTEVDRGTEILILIPKIQEEE